MILNTLFSEPMIFLAWMVAIVLALTVHEFAHAWAGYLLGDDTAKSQGRLTLNPLSHVSGTGLLMLVLIGVGWGKPVPFNPYNLKFRRFGAAILGAAGPIANLVMALFFGVILHYLLVFNVFLSSNLLIQFLSIFVVLNVILLLFNLLPIPPLDGSKVLFSFLDSPRFFGVVSFLENKGPLILIMLLFLDNIIGLNIFGTLFSGVINLVYKAIFF
jgi:Zn-dependent protease